MLSCSCTSTSAPYPLGRYRDRSLVGAASSGFWNRKKATYQNDCLNVSACGRSGCMPTDWLEFELWFGSFVIPTMEQKPVCAWHCPWAVSLIGDFCTTLSICSEMISDREPQHTFRLSHKSYYSDPVLLQAPELFQRLSCFQNRNDIWELDDSTVFISLR